MIPTTVECTFYPCVKEKAEIDVMLRMWTQIQEALTSELNLCLAHQLLSVLPSHLISQLFPSVRAANCCKISIFAHSTSPVVVSAFAVMLDESLAWHFLPPKFELLQLLCLCAPLLPQILQDDATSDRRKNKRHRRHSSDVTRLFIFYPLYCLILLYFQMWLTPKHRLMTPNITAWKCCLPLWSSS